MYSVLSAAPFEHEKAYTKFAAYALLNHKGDFAAAAKDLAAKGYGSFESGEKTLDWGEPCEIKDELLPVPHLTKDMVPDDIWNYAADVSERAGTQIDFVVCSLLSLCGSLIGRGCGIWWEKAR